MMVSSRMMWFLEKCSNQWSKQGLNILFKSLDPFCFQLYFFAFAFQFDSLDFIAGHYDCELGLAGCGKWFLEKDKVSALTQSAMSIIGQEFVLLVDSYTNKENEKTLVLHRALCVNER